MSFTNMHEKATLQYFEDFTQCDWLRSDLSRWRFNGYLYLLPCNVKIMLHQIH